MKNLKMSMMVVTILALLNLAGEAQEKAKPYDYPFKPGTNEWKAFTTVAQAREACQIPEQVLKNLATSDLLETCLDYPFFSDVFLFNNVQSGFNAVTQDFNGLEELLKRKDAGKCLITKYKEMDPAAFDANWSLEKKGEYAIRFCSVEILLAQEGVLNGMKEEDRVLLLQECSKKATEKNRHSMYSTFDFSWIGLIEGRILLKENFQPFIDNVTSNKNLEVFLQKGTMPNPSLVTQIFEHAMKFLLDNRR